MYPAIEWILRLTIHISTYTASVNRKALPFDDMDKQHSCCLLHRFDHDSALGCHGRVGLFEGIEVQDGIQDLIGSLGTSTDESGKRVYGGINRNGIAEFIS